MKHKKFNEIYPYTYFVENKETNMKYYGVRYGNLKLSLSPNQDLGVKYFSSSDYLKSDFKNKPDGWYYTPHYTFDTVDEALSYEQKFLTKVYKKPCWINKTNNRSFDMAKVVRDYDFVEAATRASTTMSSDIVEGLNMHQRRSRKGVETRRRCGTDKIMSDKQKITKSKVGEDGLTISQRAYRKSPRPTGSAEAKAVGAKAKKTFWNKLKSMTDREFTEYCSGYSERYIRRCTTIRNQ